MGLRAETKSSISSLVNFFAKSLELLRHLNSYSWQVYEWSPNVLPGITVSITCFMFFWAFVGKVSQREKRRSLTHWLRPTTFFWFCAQNGNWGTRANVIFFSPKLDLYPLQETWRGNLNWECVTLSWWQGAALTCWGRWGGWPSQAKMLLNSCTNTREVIHQSVWPLINLLACDSIHFESKIYLTNSRGSFIFFRSVHIQNWE